MNTVTNLEIVNFLDVTFNLNNGMFKTYKKLNDILLYIKKSSNDLPQIIKQLPKIISNRLLKNSSNEEVFNESKGEYENSLKQSGYNNINLKYQPLITFNMKQKHHQNITWFDVSTNVAKSFCNCYASIFLLLTAFIKYLITIL